MNCTSTLVRDVNKQCRKIIAEIVAGSSVSSTDRKWLLCNTEVSPRLQGKQPRCGLSALSMAIELLQKHRGDNTMTLPVEKEEEQELESLLKMAQSKGFSCQGEMYSAENLAKLGKEFYGVECLVASDGFEDDNFVISEVLKGHAVLVPYDADKNHEPCLENGHRAHWVLITGLLCELDDNSFDWTLCKQDINMPTLFHASEFFKLMLQHNCKPQHIYFCAKHGKSRHTAVWTSESLKSSNGNLFDLDPSKEKQAGDYVIPEGGIHQGLCDVFFEDLVLAALHLQNPQ